MYNITCTVHLLLLDSFQLRYADDTVLMAKNVEYNKQRSNDILNSTKTKIMSISNNTNIDAEIIVNDATLESLGKLSHLGFDISDTCSDT